MLINKITTGFVIQVFDLSSGDLTSQEFCAGDQCDYEYQDGQPLSDEDDTKASDFYHPFDMEQPQK